MTRHDPDSSTAGARFTPASPASAGTRRGFSLTAAWCAVRGSASRFGIALRARPVLAARLPLLVPALFPILTTGCISYTVGQGAETTAPGERSYSSSMNLVPGTLSNSDSSASTRRPSVDSDIRWGVDDRTDIGFRIATYSGFMLTWKRQLTRADTSSAPENRMRTALMLGGGLLNAGEHAGLEMTLITSSKWSSAGQWYAAARAIQVFPITNSARSDDPVAGVAFGHLFGDRDKSIGPEIGVYYDRSTLGLNRNRILVIPSLVVRGQALPWFGRRSTGGRF